MLKYISGEKFGSPVTNDLFDKGVFCLAHL